MLRKIVTVIAGIGVALGAVLLPASAASASQSLVYFEKVAPEDVIFVPACVPGPQNPTCDPRGPGSWFSSVGDLSRVQGGPAIGQVTVYCLTTRKVGPDYFGLCTEVLYTPEGTFEARGEINESALERFVPQQMPLFNGGTGALTVQQITYPDQFVLVVGLA